MWLRVDLSLPILLVNRRGIIGIQVLGGLLFCLLFGVLLYLGTGAVDWFNRLSDVRALDILCGALVAVGASHVNPELLKHRDWTAVTAVIPAVIVSFGFHIL